MANPDMCVYHKAVEVRIDGLCKKLEEKEAHLRIETELKIRNLMTEEFNNRLKHLESIGLVREGKRSISDWLTMAVISIIVVAIGHYLFKF